MSSASSPSYENDMGLADDYINMQASSGVRTPTPSSMASSQTSPFDGRPLNSAQIAKAPSSARASSSGVSDYATPPPLTIPESPAAQGYIENPYSGLADGAHELFNRELSLDDSFWESNLYEDGVGILLRKRDINHTGSIPRYKGKTFIPNFRPIEVLACIHLLSYRLIWDTRMCAGRILQRYGHHDFLFYTVYRGVGNLYRPRDAVGFQDTRFWGPFGESQTMALPNTERIDIIWRSADSSEVPPQEGKVRMHIEFGGYRILWRPEFNGCDVIWTGDADVHACIPTYLWKVLAKELPKAVGRLRDAMQSFGVPPYVIDIEECVVLQMAFFYSESRRSTHRHHVSKPGTYSIMIDRPRMFPNGLGPVKVTGPGASAVSVQELGDRLLINVAPHGVRLEYLIEIEPRDKLGEPDAQGGWW